MHEPRQETRANLSADNTRVVSTIDFFWSCVRVSLPHVVRSLATLDHVYQSLLELAKCQVHGPYDEQREGVYTDHDRDEHGVH